MTDKDADNINKAFRDLMEYEYSDLYHSAALGVLTARACHDDVTLLKLAVLALHEKIEHLENAR